MTEINLTREMMKAETALRRCRRNAQKAATAVELAWLKREQKLVETFPEQTRRHLIAIGLLSPLFEPYPKFDETFTLDETDVEENPSTQTVVMT